MILCYRIKEKTKKKTKNKEQRKFIMPIVPSLNINEAKVFENSGLKMHQEFVLQTLEKEFNEIMGLLELFGSKETSCKLEKLNDKYDKYASIFEPKIKEAKRVLKNTVKRVDYNVERC